MENKAENVVSNIGAIAEVTSVFYNTLAGKVPKDVALELTRHFMSLTINRQIRLTPAQLAQAAAMAEAKRRELEQRRQAQSTPESKEPETPEATGEPPLEPPEQEKK